MKLHQLAACLVLSTSGLSYGAAGIYDSFIFTTTNAGGNVFYDIGAITANPEFNGTNLGTFSLTDAFRVGGQQKSFKNGGTDVTGHQLFWRVWLTSGGPTGSFTSVNMPFQWNQGNVGAPAGLNNPGDQQWGGDVQGANGTLTRSGNVLTSLTPGSYTLEVYSQITTNSNGAAPVIGNVNGGNNYRATFTLVPEPSTALLGLVGSAMLLRRRRI